LWWGFVAAAPKQNPTNLSLYTAYKYPADFREIHPF
jgi:hypothetical protein